MRTPEAGGPLPEQEAPAAAASSARGGALVGGAPVGGAPAAEALEVVPLRHPWRWVFAILSLAILVSILYSLATNPNISLPTIIEYLFDRRVLRGVSVTLYLTAIAMTLGFLGGVVLAVMRLSPNPVLSSLAKLYIWFFRGTPLLVQLIFWAYAGAVYQTIKIGIPFTDVVWYSFQTQDLIGPTLAALLALIFNEFAYSAEIVRGGILAVPHGQVEAAKALGLGPGRTMRRIVLPQAMSSMLPPLGSELISMVKFTSLVAVIGGADLMTQVQQIYGQTFQVIPMLIVASIWYLFLVSILSVGQQYLERRFGKGVAQQRQRARGRLFGLRRRWSES